MAITQGIKNEIYRKATLNIPLSEPTQEKQKLYDKYRTNYLNRQKNKKETVKEEPKKDVAVSNKIKNEEVPKNETNTTKDAVNSNDNQNVSQPNQNVSQPNQNVSQSQVVSPTNTIQQPSSSDVSNQLLEAQKKKTIGDLKVTKEKALLQLGTEQQAIAPQYQSMKSQAATQSMQQARNFGEYMAARGQTTSGLAAQAELSRGTGLTRQLGEIGQQQQSAQDALNARKSQIAVDFQSQIANAKSAFEIQKLQQQYQSAISSEEKAYNEKLISQGQQFQASEAEKGRTFSAEQADIARSFSAEQDEISRNFSKEQADVAREFTKTMTQEERDFIKGQREEDRANFLLDLAESREYEKTLTVEERAFENQKTIEQRTFEANQRRLDRQAVATASSEQAASDQAKAEKDSLTNSAIDRVRLGTITEILPAKPEVRNSLTGYLISPAIPERENVRQLSEEEIGSGLMVENIIKNSSQIRSDYGDANYERILKEAQKERDRLAKKYKLS